MRQTGKPVQNYGLLKSAFETVLQQVLSKAALSQHGLIDKSKLFHSPCVKFLDLTSR